MKTYGTARTYQNENRGDGTIKAAIVVFDQNITVTVCHNFTTNNIATVIMKTNVWEILVVSYYFEPNADIDLYIKQLMKIHEGYQGKNILMGGDANAKSILWCGLHTDSRGSAMMRALTETGLQVLNAGDVPTFDTIGGNKRYTSYVDISVCSDEMLDLVADWKVAEDLTSSDHNGIILKLYL